MDMNSVVKTLLPVTEPDGTIVTLTLDLAGTGTLPQATRVFLKDEVLNNLHSEARPAAARTLLRKLGKRVTDLVDNGLQPGSKGLYLVAGRGIWMPLELKARMKNFIVTGSAPYLPPLLALESKAPRGYLVLVEGNTVEIQELLHGEARSVFRQEGAAPTDDREHRAARAGMKGSNSGGGGGAERDRRQQRENESFRTLLHEAEKQLGLLQARAPAEIIFVAGPKDLRSEVERHLNGITKGRLKVLGMPGAEVLPHALRDLEALGEGRIAALGLEFHEARAQGGKVALGPNEVLQALWSGRTSRLYLDEYDPLPGVRCTGCGVHHLGLERRCPFCDEDVVATSIAQDVVAYTLSHKPTVGLTFVGANTGWLRELGGLAALLATKGARARKSPALK